MWVPGGRTISRAPAVRSDPVGPKERPPLRGAALFPLVPAFADYGPIHVLYVPPGCFRPWEPEGPYFP